MMGLAHLYFCVTMFHIAQIRRGRRDVEHLTFIVGALLTCRFVNTVHIAIIRCASRDVEICCS